MQGFCPMIRVLLINPPQQHYKGSVNFDLQLPLGLMYVAAMVKNICHVEIFDCLLVDHKTKKGNLVIYGAPLEEIRKIIEEKKPDVIGISDHAAANYRNAELVAIIAKEVNPKIITVFGGPDPSVRFESILENWYCDYCVIGEGEQTFYEFVQNFSSKLPLENIKGLACKRNGIILYSPRPFCTNLDSIPFPAFDIVNMKKYLNSKYLYRNRSKICSNSISIITSRGCPNHCVFCSIRLHMGQQHRSHSPEYVIKLLRLCIGTYGITNFHFEDDNLSCDKRKFEKILDYIIKDNLQMHWDTPNGIRADSLDFNILTKMKKSGLSMITLAIESGNQRVLDEVINKKSKLENVIDIVKQCEELKIPANAFYVIGFPGETIDEIKDTTKLAVKLYRKYNLSPLLMMATPLHGTDLYDLCKRYKFIKEDPTCEDFAVATQPFGKPMISTPDFSIEDLKRVIKQYKRSLSLEVMHRVLKHPRKIVAWIKDEPFSF